MYYLLHLDNRIHHHKPKSCWHIFRLHLDTTIDRLDIWMPVERKHELNSHRNCLHSRPFHRKCKLKKCPIFKIRFSAEKTKVKTNGINERAYLWKHIFHCHICRSYSDMKSIHIPLRHYDHHNHLIHHNAMQSEYKCH